VLSGCLIPIAGASAPIDQLPQRALTVSKATVIYRLWTPPPIAQALSLC